MRTLLISALPIDHLPENWQETLGRHAHTIDTNLGPRNLMRPLHTPLRCGATIAIFPPSKRWLYTNQGERFVKDLKTMALHRRFEIRWLHPEKTRGRHGIAPIGSLDAWQSLVNRRNPVLLTPSNNRLVFVGDIHGYLEQAKQAIAPWKDSNAAYFFTGDYVSKGPESLKTLEWITHRFLKPNTGHILTGNHEIHLEDWLMGINQSKADFLNTWPSAAQPGAHCSKKFISHFLSHLHEALDIRWNNHRFLVTHGGVEHPDHTDDKAAHYIYGPGTPTTDIDTMWQSNESNTIQVHGHRNPKLRTARAIKTSWNLEGIESAGEVRVIALTKKETGIEGTERTVSFDGEVTEKNFLLD